jgi:hypothetical protein
MYICIYTNVYLYEYIIDVIIGLCWNKSKLSKANVTNV